MAGHLSGCVKCETAKFLCPSLHSNLHLISFFLLCRICIINLVKVGNFRNNYWSLNQHFSYLGNRFRTEIEKASHPIHSHYQLCPASCNQHIHTYFQKSLQFPDQFPGMLEKPVGIKESLWREIPKQL